MLAVLCLIAQADADILPVWLKSLIQLGNSALLFYLIAVIAPRMTAEATKERNGMYAMFNDWLAKLQEAFERRNADTRVSNKETNEAVRLLIAANHREIMTALEKHHELTMDLIMRGGGPPNPPKRAA